MLISDFLREAWSEKYKRSINCKHPRGFSQRAHCQGRKKHRNESIENEDAVSHLATALKSTGETSYAGIDGLMCKIAKDYKITTKELHDRWVREYGKTPDDWIKEKLAHRLDEANKASKAEAGYKDKSTNDQRCINCTMWRDPHYCSAVAGKISPNGWCKWFAAGAPGKHGHRVDEAKNDLQSIIQSFVSSPIGQKYKAHDCKTVTRAFVQWAKENNIPVQVLSLAPPSAEMIKQNPKLAGKSGEGDGHCMPVVNGMAIDFTVRQFGVARAYEDPLVTPLSNVRAVYQRIGGYFTDAPEWFLGGKSYYLGPWESIPASIMNMDFGDELLS